MSLKEMTRLNAALNALYMEQDDIYSAYAAHFGLSDTAFWILYAICESDEVKTLLRGRTSFVIAHRLSTVTDADLILYMEEGNIVESGSHEALLETGGHYAALYNSQFS